jgi:hypothetical protein
MEKRKNSFIAIVETSAESINSPVDVFDALPRHIQENHELLTRFCHWYLKSKYSQHRINSSGSYYFKDKMQAMALKIHKDNDNLKAPAILDHPDMKAFIKKARAESEATAAPERWARWIQKIIKMKKEQGWDKSP